MSTSDRRLPKLTKQRKTRVFIKSSTSGLLGSSKSGYVTVRDFLVSIVLAKIYAVGRALYVMIDNLPSAYDLPYIVPRSNRSTNRYGFRYNVRKRNAVEQFTMLLEESDGLAILISFNNFPVNEMS
jgi:hypothetical protein